MVKVAEPLASLSSCPSTTLHPCVPGEPASPWDQFAWYSTIPAGSEVGVGEDCLAEGTVVCDGTVVEDVAAEQAPRAKSRNTTRNARGMETRFKRRSEERRVGKECRSRRSRYQ